MEAQENNFNRRPRGTGSIARRGYCQDISGKKNVENDQCSYAEW